MLSRKSGPQTLLLEFMEHAAPVPGTQFIYTKLIGFIASLAGTAAPLVSKLFLLG